MFAKRREFWRWGIEELVTVTTGIQFKGLWPLGGEGSSKAGNKESFSNNN